MATCAVRGIERANRLSQADGGYGFDGQLHPHPVCADKVRCVATAREGVDNRVVQEILGHSSPNITRRYTHVTSWLAREAADRMGNVAVVGVETTGYFMILLNLPVDLVLTGHDRCPERDSNPHDLSVREV